MTISKVFYFLFFLLTLKTAVGITTQEATLSITSPNVRLVSLGRDCEPSFRLANNGIREEAFPFDWNQTHDFNAILKAIDDDFLCFLESKNLTLDEPWRVHDTYYNMYFVHDFPTVHTPIIATDDDLPTEGSILNSFLEHLETVKQKYTRRINRLKLALESSDPILFFRTHITQAQASQFTQLIARKYPKLNYILIVIHCDATAPKDWHISHVKSFFVNTFVPLSNPLSYYSWFEENEWKNIFRACFVLP